MPLIYSDLKVEDTGLHTSNLANLSELVKLGYKVLALNRTYHCKSKKELQNAGDPMLEIKERKIRLESDLESEFGQDVMRTVKILLRSTFVADTVEDIGTICKQPYYKKIIDSSDLVAYVPGNEKICKMIIEKQHNCDVIALKMDEKMDFVLNHHTVGQAVRNKLVFELVYAPAIKSSSIRKYIFRNGVELVDKARGKGIIISSGGEHKMDFRSPNDIINLGNLFNLRGSQCSDAIGKNCQAALMHMETRKYTYKGVLKIKTLNDSEPCVSIGQKRQNRYDHASSKAKKRKH